MKAEVTIDAESVNKALIGALLQSSLGEQIQAAITKATDVKNTQHVWALPPVQQAVNDFVLAQAKTILEQRFTEEVQRMLQERLTPEFFQAAVKKLLEKLRKNLEGMS